MRLINYPAMAKRLQHPILVILVFLLLSLVAAQPVDKVSVQPAATSQVSASAATSAITPFEVHLFKVRCEDVHSAKDKCAFIKKHCDDYDSGLLSYLDLYFCKMYSVFPVYWTLMVIWLFTLFASIGVSASEFLTVNLGSLSWKFNMSSSLAGVTFLALGNGSPDLFSTFTAMSNHSGSLAIGELIGAAGFITTVVAAVTGYYRPFRVKRYGFMRDVIFFALAVAFSLYFLIDGHLALWECIVMVVFYIIYVASVFSWDFILARVQRRKKRHARARSHFTAAQNVDRLREPSPVPMGDFDGSQPAGPGATEQDALLSPPVRESEDEEDEEGPGTRDQMLAQLAEIAGQMRVTNRHRRTFSRMTKTAAPIRPSLLGAAEFGSVLSSLERSRSMRSRSPSPHARRSSEGPSLMLPSQARSASDMMVPTVSTSKGGSGSESSSLLEPQRAATRVRSVSASAADVLSHRPSPPRPMASAVHPGSPISVVADSAENTANEAPQRPNLRLEVPQAHAQVPKIFAIDESGQQSAVTADDVSTFTFPRYTDDPQAEVVASPGAITPGERPPSWPLTRKPSRLWTLLSRVGRILFPQMRDWAGKSYFDRVLSTLAIPIIIVLTLTVPIGDIPETELKAANSVSAENAQSRPNTQGTQKSGADAHGPERAGSFLSSGSISPLLSPISERGEPLLQRELKGDDDEPWNPWLVSIQIMTSPIFFFFVVYKGWLKVEDNGMEMIIWSCAILGFSAILLAAFWYTNTPNKAPSWQPWLAVPGFFIAIAWISMIAEEIVGVLKAFQLITGFSEAILGLIVFAAGNSISDLFANLATARLGKPVMAFHACFGGPMLNILLGIGLGGMYHTIQKGRKHSHNGSAPLGTEFHIDVGRTLIVSGVGLLVTLLGLFVAIWRNKWIMDRKIGVGLMVAWVTITVVNVVLEVLQMNGKIKPW